MTGVWAMYKRLGVLALAAAALVAAVAVPATRGLAQDGISAAGAMVTVNATGGDVRAAGASVIVSGAAANIKAAGASVALSADAAGSVWAFGGKVVVGGTIGADLAAAGASVNLTGKVTGDAGLCGAVVEINAPIGGNLRTGGANVTIGPLTDIAGRLDAGGANVSMSGHVHGAARLAGATVIFNGRTDGPLTLAGEHVVVGSFARIGGDLTVYSRQDPEIAPEAVVNGAVHRFGPPAEWRNIPSWAFGFVLAGAMVLGTILAGIVLMLFGGRLFLTALDHARLRPVSTILIGVITLVLVPAVAAILGATVVGLPVGIALMLALPLLFVFGHPIAAAGIAAGIFVRNPGPIGIARALLFVVLGAIVIALISLIPWVGPLAVAIVIVLGVGALVRTAGGRLRTPGQRGRMPVAEPPQPAPPPRPAEPPPPPPSPPPPPEPAPEVRPEQAGS